MIRPVERFAVNIGGLQVAEEPVLNRLRPPPAGFGVTSLVAAACLGASATLLVQRLLAEGSLAGLLAAVLRSLAG